MISLTVAKGLGVVFMQDKLDQNKWRNMQNVRLAFDSIPRNLQCIAWVRLGVPPDVSEWFVQLDDGGLSYIATPQFFQKHKLHASEKMAEHAEHFTVSDFRTMAFTAARGVGQGESASSLMWVALHDMLLEWIDPEKVTLLYKEEPPIPTTMRTPRAMANAYADDLSTLTSGKTAFYWQQRHRLTTGFLPSAHSLDSNYSWTRSSFSN
jgi:hypothetical protein